MSCRVLVLAADYLDTNGGIALAYIHTRNQQYIKNDICVDVLNFSCKQNYVIDSINVISLESYERHPGKYDLLIIHAANLRNHLKFLKRHGDCFDRFLFFYHGHEVMYVNHEYSEPYPYMKKRGLKYFTQDIYDGFKMIIWRCYLKKVISKSYFVFVSQWMKNIFDKNIKLEKEINNRFLITYNSVGKLFEEKNYDDETIKKYDFVTIRGVLDGSKYAVDIVNSIAKNTPEAKFLLIGKGCFFEHFDKADNIEWRNIWLNQAEMIRVLNQAKYALMPTRTDAQGLMMCEMAAFGIPVITSNIDVCHEVFDGFRNVIFIENDENVSLSSLLTRKSRCVKDDRYYMCNTVNKEIALIKSLVKEKGNERDCFDNC